MTKWFEGKVALVTGGGSGIGRATALAFAREGARTVISDVDVDGGGETVRMIKSSGGEATFVKADVSLADEVEALVHKAVQTYGQLDCAFNNAGLERELTNPDERYAEETFQSVIDTNLKGVWLCMKHEIAQMLEQGLRRNRQHLVGRGFGRHTSPTDLCSQQARGLRTDQVGRRGVRRQGYPHQRRVSGSGRHAPHGTYLCEQPRVEGASR